MAELRQTRRAAKGAHKLPSPEAPHHHLRDQTSDHVTMHSLLDNAARYLEDASPKTSLASEEELPVEDMECFLEDDQSVSSTHSRKSQSELIDQTPSEDDELEEAESPPRLLHHPRRRLSRKKAPSTATIQSRYKDSSEDLSEELENASISGNDTHQETWKLSGVQPPHFVYPRSQYKGPPPMRISLETEVMSDFSDRAVRNQELDEEDKDFVEYELTDFSVYVPGHVKWRGFELVSLNNLGRHGMNTLLFDGTLSDGTVSHYVQGVRFNKCPIGNIGEQTHQVGGEIWIKSVLNSSQEVYYKLKEPAPEYERFQDGFNWLADLAKHVIDYLHFLDDRDELATVQHFRAKFEQYLKSRHGNEQCFQEWNRNYNSTDFRTAINANIDFLYNQALGVDEELSRHTIWAELLHFTAIPAQPIEENQTVVTPFVYRCFKEMKYSHLLKPKTPVPEVTGRRLFSKNALQMPVAADLATGSYGPLDSSPSSEDKTTSGYYDLEDSEEVSHPYREEVQEGDVLAVFADAEEVTQWKSKDELWYVYVTKVRKRPTGRRIFNVIWLYKPAHTICGQGFYPYENELFFSSHCNCDHQVELADDDVHSKVSVVFGKTPTESNFFIRSTYSEEEHSFVSFEDSHRNCKHQKDQCNSRESPESLQTNKYERGETVLVEVPMPEEALSDTSKRLDPCEIVDSFHDPANRVRLRRLRRRNEIDGEEHATNELVYTDEFFDVRQKYIVRRCLVRFYHADEQVPPPYSRNGTGDAFFITTRLKVPSPRTTGIKEEPHLIPIDDDRPETLLEGFDPTSKPVLEKLRGLDLYCGGGNFSRGLDEAGAVSHKWAVDSDPNAIHTYFANLGQNSKTSLFLGSVDDMLSQAMENNPNNSTLIPLPGEVDFIAAGNPCQAFSRMNSKKESEGGLKNQSLLASVAAYIDFYRPKYAFLENVVAMASGKPISPLSQLVCFAVGLGYQVQIFKIDAWSCGSPQSRSRLIVSLAAHGYQLPPYPAISHSPPSNSRDYSLGETASGDKFGLREFGPTAFPFVSAAEATRDLPDIGDAQTKICIPFPDHVVSRLCLPHIRTQIQQIPRYPRGLNFYKTYSAGRRGGTIVDEDAILMTDEHAELFGTGYTKTKGVRECFRKGSKAFGRIRPDGVFPPILCIQSLQCSRSGTALHWDQHRLITIMEARRAQDFPDHEVLTGSRRIQFRIVGNSVPRSVSLALGLSLRTAWLKNEVDDSEIDSQPTNSPGTSGSLVFPSREKQTASGRGTAHRSASRGSQDNIEEELSAHQFQDLVQSSRDPKRRKVTAKQHVGLVPPVVTYEADPNPSVENSTNEDHPRIGGKRRRY